MQENKKEIFILFGIIPSEYQRVASLVMPHSDAAHRHSRTSRLVDMRIGVSMSTGHVCTNPKGQTSTTTEVHNLPCVVQRVCGVQFTWHYLDSRKVACYLLDLT